MNIDTLIETVRELAVHSPHNVYSSEGLMGCSNVAGSCSDGSVGCIVGQAIRRIDPEFSFRGDEKSDIGTLCSRHGWALISDSRVRWLSKVQNTQDQNVPWAMCVSWADEVIVL
jgi:hypothetical protein